MKQRSALLGVAVLLVGFADPTWQTTGSLAQARTGHRAVRLLDGRVLVAGGASSCETYNPGTGLWSTTGSLRKGSTVDSMTVLPGGKVLAIGSTTSNIYDPSSGRWSRGPSFNWDRTGHTATLLNNGTVLIAGGYGRGYYPSDCLLYDAASNQLTATGSMTVGRAWYSATRLQDGRVLAVSGYGAGASCEIYNPVTGTWRATGFLISAHRLDHCAVLLNDGRVLVAGGRNFNVMTTLLETFDPRTETWSFAGNSAYDRLASATLLRSGRVLLLGCGNSTQFYDPGTATVQSSVSMLGPSHASFTTTLLGDGSVLVAGGTEGQYSVTAACYRLTP